MDMGTMEITTKIGCKINCKFCPQKKLLQEYYKENKKAEELLSLETFKICIDKIPKEVRIDFSGMCEPWLNPDCTKMVEYASQKGHKISIFTTLTGMSIEDVKRLEELNIEQIVIHIADEQMHSHINIDKDYKKVLQEMININKNCNKGLSCHGSIPEELKNFLNYEWETGDIFVDRAGNIEEKNLQHTKYKKGQLFCSLSGDILNHNVLLPDGRVLLCCMDYSMQHVVGNLKKDSYEELFLNPIMKEIRQKLTKEDSNLLCRKCSNAVSFEGIEKSYLEIKEKNNELWKAKKWIEREYKKQKKTLSELRKYILELEETKKYLLGKSDTNEKLITEQKEWIDKLEEAKKYLLGKSDTNEKLITEQREWIDKLEEAKKYLLGKSDTNEKLITEQKEWIDKLEEAKKYLLGKSDTNEKLITEQREWINKLEEAKKYLSEKSEINKTIMFEQKQRIEKLEKSLKEKEGTIEQIENELEMVKNETAKYKHFLAILKNDKIIKRIINIRKYNC